MSTHHQSIFIGGEWVRSASTKRLEVFNASTEELLGSVPECNREDVDRAVTAARQALKFSAWATMSAADRGAALGRFADALEKRAPRLAAAVSQQNGMPINTADQLEAGYTIALMRYYAHMAGQLAFEENRPSPLGFNSVVRRNPVGVVGAIIPWNFPVILSMMKIAPALVAGCTLVIKPSSGTVMDCYVLAEAAEEAQLPAGVINWLPGSREIGSYLVSHPGVDKVAFTGSTGAGRTIARACGELLRPVSLELGGKSAAIVLDDVDLDALLAALPTISLTSNGQACFSCTRILVPDSRYKEIVDAIASTVSAYVVGDAMDRATQIGPLGSAAHRDRVEGYLAKGRDEGRVVTGGGRPKQLGRGWFVEPTVFADVDNGAVIAQEEIFGPVLSIIKYGRDDEAVRIANDSEYGLGGSVWSVDRERALNLARRVETGSIGINGYMVDMNSPFGGVKSSGLGREMGPESVTAYQQLQSIFQMG